MLQRTENFRPDEREVALELVDATLKDTSSGYACIVAVEPDDKGGAEQVIGYVCFGRTPMTDAAFDLYWMVVDAAHRRRGVGRALVRAFEETVTQQGGHVVRVETSSKSGYRAAQRFYERVGFTVAGRIPGFYRADDDLVILFKAT